MNIYEISLKKHQEWRGKICTQIKSPLENKEDLSIAYTPGVAQPCLEIAKNKEEVFKYTWKSNTVAVISDGTAVLGLGDIGPEAALPVMEGKAVLFKRFADVDAIPIVLDTKDTQEIIETVRRIAPTFGGINLEDISAPRCVEIERKLIEELDIPVFHDDQHGTAIVVTSGIINALKLVGKRPEDCTVVVSGTGAAGSSIIKMIKSIGIDNILAFNRKGILVKDKNKGYNFLEREIVLLTNNNSENITFSEAMAKADIFIGVSAPKIVTQQMVSSMKQDSIVFALANPEPEIGYDDAIKAGARIVGTGRSDFPNQVNNVLAFPGLFRGALDVRSRKITEEMKLAAAKSIASLISDNELKEDYVIPNVFDPRVAKIVARAVSEKAIEQNLNR